MYVDIHLSVSVLPQVRLPAGPRVRAAAQSFREPRICLRPPVSRGPGGGACPACPAPNSVGSLHGPEPLPRAPFRGERGACRSPPRGAPAPHGTREVAAGPRERALGSREACAPRRGCQRPLYVQIHVYGCTERQTDRATYIQTNTHST